MPRSSERSLPWLYSSRTLRACQHPCFTSEKIFFSLPDRKKINILLPLSSDFPPPKPDTFMLGLRPGSASPGSPPAAVQRQLETTRPGADAPHTRGGRPADAARTLPANIPLPASPSVCIIYTVVVLSGVKKKRKEGDYQGGTPGPFNHPKTPVYPPSPNFIRPADNQRITLQSNTHHLRRLPASPRPGSRSLNEMYSASTTNSTPTLQKPRRQQPPP